MFSNLAASLSALKRRNTPPWTIQPLCNCSSNVSLSVVYCPHGLAFKSRKISATCALTIANGCIFWTLRTVVLRSYLALCLFSIGSSLSILFCLARSLVIYLRCNSAFQVFASGFHPLGSRAAAGFVTIHASVFPSTSSCRLDLFDYA